MWSGTGNDCDQISLLFFSRPSSPSSSPVGKTSLAGQGELHLTPVPHPQSWGKMVALGSTKPRAWGFLLVTRWAMILASREIGVLTILWDAGMWVQVTLGLTGKTWGKALWTHTPHAGLWGLWVSYTGLGIWFLGPLGIVGGGCPLVATLGLSFRPEAFFGGGGVSFPWGLGRVPLDWPAIERHSAQAHLSAHPSTHPFSHLSFHPSIHPPTH